MTGRPAGVERVVEAAARRGERWVSACRAAFCSAVLLRTLLAGDLWTDAGTLHPKLWLFPPAVGVAIGFSLWMIHRSRRPLPPSWLGVSVAVDAVVCTLSLLPNALWPFPGYGGAITVPDTAALLLMVVAAGFRLSPRVAALGAVLNGAGAVLLVVVDGVRGTGVPDSEDALLALIFWAATATLALAIALQTRRLVQGAADESIRSERARQGLDALLQDHHDVRSLLSSANLHSELLLRELPDDDPARPRAQAVRADLRAVSEFLAALKDRALQETSLAQGLETVELLPALRSILDIALRGYPHVAVDLAVPPGLSVKVAGGALSLERVLLNLLVNACEGDGVRGARHIHVRADTRNGEAVLTIEDDGPGFSAASLHAPVSHAVSTKPDGSGLGLFLVDSIVSASEGTVSLQTSDDGGARVQLQLLRS